MNEITPSTSYADRTETTAVKDVAADPRACMKVKPKLKTNPVPAHALAAPKGAPSCYGDLEVRIASRACNICSLREHCADFVDRASHDAALGLADGGGTRFRAVWPAEAPLIVDQERFQAQVAAFFERLATSAERRHWEAIYHEHISSGEMVRIAARAYGGGLITLGAAIEIAQVGAGFYSWLEDENPRRRWVRDPQITALVWVTATITRRVLRWQGRANAFTPRLHHEVWTAITDRTLSRNALRKRLPTADDLSRHYKWVMSADA